MGSRSGGGRASGGGFGSASKSKGNGGRASGGGVSMPALTGSEKQVSWANDIRDRALKAIESTVPYATQQSHKDIIGRIKKNIASKTDAKFWIDNRYRMPRAFSNPSSPSAAKSAVKGVMLDFNSAGLYS